jgi:flagellar hook-basal body complex protein FliE
MSVQAVSSFASLSPASAAAGARAHTSAPGNAPFSQVVAKLIGDANAQQLQSNQVVEQFATGQTDNVHDLVLSVAKADLSFRLVLEIRNRLIDSYQEIMRMQM